jgi:hypothetical protein
VLQKADGYSIQAGCSLPFCSYEKEDKSTKKKHTRSKKQTKFSYEEIMINKL